jgi:DNA-binding transcriptional regulator WhiA
MGNRIDIDYDLIIKKYSELKNIKKVAESFGVSIRPIKRILNKKGIKLTNRRYDVNHSYFETIDTEEKAYWLGFLFADGCVRKTNSGNQLVLKLSIKDESHLNLFKSHIESEHKVFHSRNKTLSKKGKVSISDNCIIRISSKKLVGSLIGHGCVPRKTSIIDKPNIDENFYKDFIRGYYDGDGNFFYSDKTKLSVLTIVCASENFRKFLIGVISKIPNIGKIHEDKGKFTIKITNIVGIMGFLSYIYNDSNVELTRKKEYYEKYREYRKYIESNYQRGLCGGYVKTT